ncbi:MAG TPA: alkaline phosphatase family protein [Hanamia sp.]|nr:alkaline phosphatase family protein [Hanamia sp.]
MRKTEFIVICLPAVKVGLFTAILFFSSCSSKKTIPKPDHIIIVVEENHGYDQIIGSENAPYINQLADEGTLFTNSEAVTHPSQPNYLALFSGSLQGIDGDRCLDKVAPFTTPNLGAALLQHGYTFTGFSESLTKPGSLECFYEESKGYDYARKHAPWVNWQGSELQKNELPDSTNQPLTSFPSDFNKLPTVSFVIPNEGNDMHNIDIDGDTAAIKRGDKWLNDHLSAYVEWAKKNNSMLIVTFDEDDGGSMIHNHIPTIFVGDKIKQGHNSSPINHYSVLRTVESMYDLPLSGKAKDAKPIRGIWK